MCAVLILFLLVLFCISQSTAILDYSKLQTPCYFDMCNYLKYCDNVTERCEFCSNIFSNCFTAKQEPQCTQFCMLNKPCQQLGYFEHGSTNATDREFWKGETVAFQCDDGYHNTGVGTTTCSDYGIWSHQQLGVKPPICEVNLCAVPNPPEHGRVILANSTNILRVGEKVRYECEDGFRMSSGNETRICSLHGNWSGVQPICSDKPCQQLGYFQHGSTNATDREFWQGETVAFQCDDGYHNTGVGTTTCSNYGILSHQSLGVKPPICEVNLCAVPNPPEHGRVILANNTNILRVGEKVRYECEDGFRMSAGNETRICSQHGNWPGVQPICTVDTCEVLENPHHGYIVSPKNTRSLRTSMEITYNCSAGYRLKGPRTRQCGANGKWTDSEPMCLAITCKGFDSPKNGYKVTPNSSVDFVSGSLIQFECYTGYTVKGRTTLQCLPDGTLDGDIHVPICTAENLLNLLTIAMIICNAGLLLAQILTCLFFKRKRNEQEYEKIKRNTVDQNEDTPSPLDEGIPINTKKDKSMQQRTISKCLPPRCEPEETKSGETINVQSSSNVDDRRLTFIGNINNAIVGHSNSLQQDEAKNISLHKAGKESPEETSETKTSSPETIVPIPETCIPDNKASNQTNEEFDNVLIAKETNL